MIKTKEVLLHIKQLSKELNFKMSFEDFMLLVNAHERNTNPDDKELAVLVDDYYANQMFADRGGDDQEILDWGKRIRILEKRNLINILPNAYVENKLGQKILKITHIEVSEEFVNKLKLNGIDIYWEYFISDECYGEEIYIGDKTIYTDMPNAQSRAALINSRDDLKKYFWKVLDNGNIDSFREAVEVVKFMKRKNALNFPIFTFLSTYKDLLQKYKKAQK